MPIISPKMLGSKYDQHLVTPPPEPRKVIQIAGVENLLFALCNDGTMWVKDYGPWRRVADVPEE